MVGTILTLLQACLGQWLFSAHKPSFMSDTLKHMSKWQCTTCVPWIFWCVATHIHVSFSFSLCVCLLLYILHFWALDTSWYMSTWYKLIYVSKIPSHYGNSHEDHFKKRHVLSTVGIGPVVLHLTNIGGGWCTVSIIRVNLWETLDQR
jgi:hypothetical protein